MLQVRVNTNFKPFRFARQCNMWWILFLIWCKPYLRSINGYILYILYKSDKKINSRYLKRYVKVEPILYLYCDVVKYICTRTNSSVISRVFTNFHFNKYMKYNITQNSFSCFNSKWTLNCLKRYLAISVEVPFLSNFCSYF